MVEFKDDRVVVVDVDGCFTSGGFYNTKEGKFLKKFGPDDWDCVKELRKYIRVNCITADKKGFGITKARIEDEMCFELDIVSHKPKERWNWIKEKYPNNLITFIGDGCYDWYSLLKSDCGITTVDALKHVRESADYVINRVGGHRFVAEVCILILEKYCGVNMDKFGIE